MSDFKKNPLVWRNQNIYIFCFTVPLLRKEPANIWYSIHYYFFLFPPIVYEGVFRTFSTDLDIVLDQCHQVDPEDPTKIDPTTVKITGVFNMKRIIRCSAFDVDLNHAKDGFMTDTQISGTNRLNGKIKNYIDFFRQIATIIFFLVPGERTLEEWIPDADEEHGVSLELEENDANGWRAEDMFKGILKCF